VDFVHAGVCVADTYSPSALSSSDWPAIMHKATDVSRMFMSGLSCPATGTLHTSRRVLVYWISSKIHI
jgi:hypothetical protein